MALDFVVWLSIFNILGEIDFLKFIGKKNQDSKLTNFSKKIDWTKYFFFSNKKFSSSNLAILALNIFVSSYSNSPVEQVLKN